MAPSQKIYTKPNPKQIIELFERAYPEFDIFGEQAVSDERIESIQSEMEEREAERDRQIAELRHQNEQMMSFLNLLKDQMALDGNWLWSDKDLLTFTSKAKRARAKK